MAGMPRYSPHMHSAYPTAGSEGRSWAGRAGGRQEARGEAQITVPVRLVRYRNGSGAEQLCDRTRGEAVGWRREVWGLIDIFSNQHVPQTCW